MMAEEIWKFPLRITDSQIIAMPPEAVLLHLGMQGDTPTLWARVNPAYKPQGRTFFMAATGEELPGNVARDGRYIGTVQTGPFVWHYFDLGPA